MRLVGAFIIIIYYIGSEINGLDNGLARTPPMGWMHWQRYRCLIDCEAYPDDCVSEKLFRKMADHLASDGYLEAGYNYIIVDDCWSEKERGPDGKLQSDRIRFPSGMKSLADYVHSKGLKFGIYADFGAKTCGGYPGSIDYLQLDAQTFAEWEVDYFKFDGCYAKIEIMPEGYAKMGKFLNKTGRPIVYSCSFPAYMEPKNIHPDYASATQFCNLWRNWDDIDDSWQSVSSIVSWFSQNQERLAPFAGPGHWNDPDMLLIGNYGLSVEQSKAQMTIWCIMAAPLIMSVDLASMEPAFKGILLNKAAIKINQDHLGIQGCNFTRKDHIDVWIRPVAGPFEDTYSYALGLVSNRTDGYPYRLNFTLNEFKINSDENFTIKNVFEDSQQFNVKVDETIFVRVKPTGAVMLLVAPTSPQARKQLKWHFCTKDVQHPKKNENMTERIEAQMV